jgi:hypothetical protein
MQFLVKLLTLLLLSLAGCGGMRPTDFKDEPLRLVPEIYFEGKSRGVGVFFDRFGGLQTSFVVDVEGSFRDDILTLTEKLTYKNGETLDRVYVIKKMSNNRYIGTTPDVEGDIIIEVYGNTMKWTYDLNQKINNSIVLLHFNDWMHLQPDGIILNRAYASKFGIRVGEVFMSIRKL